MEGVDVQQLVQFVAWDRLPYAMVVLVIGWAGTALLLRFLDDLAERFAERRLTLYKGKAFLRFFLYGGLAVIIGSSVLDLQNEAHRDLAEAAQLLSNYDSSGLIRSDKQKLRTVYGFIVQAEDALRLKDYPSAAGLARKARLLAVELTSR